MTQLTPETVDQVRNDYTNGATVAEILHKFRLSIGQAYAILDGAADDGTGRGLAPLARRRSSLAPARKRSSGSGQSALVRRLIKSAERQVGVMADRLGDENQEPNIRDLALLVKTMRELSAMKAELAPGARTQNDDHAPENLDELRRDLARRIEEIALRGDGSEMAG